MRVNGMRVLSGVRWLAAALAMLVVLALAVPGAGMVGAQTAQAAEIGSLANGDFEYPGSSPNDKYWVAITLSDGEWYNDNMAGWTPIPNFDKSKFGWTSTQTDGYFIGQKAGAVEVQKDMGTGNYYAELCAEEAGTAIYQDVKTEVGVRYTRWSWITPPRIARSSIRCR